MPPRRIHDVLASEHNEAQVVTTAVPPFLIVHVNQAWTQLCGYTASEVVGQTSNEERHGPHASAPVAALGLAREAQTSSETGAPAHARHRHLDH